MVADQKNFITGLLYNVFGVAVAIIAAGYEIRTAYNEPGVLSLRRGDLARDHRRVRPCLSDFAQRHALAARSLAAQEPRHGARVREKWTVLAEKYGLGK